MCRPRKLFYFRFALSRLVSSATADNSSDYAETHSDQWSSLSFRHPLRSLSSCSRVLERFVLSRLACSRRTASLRLGRETGLWCKPSVSCPRFGPSVRLATARSLRVVMLRLLTTCGFPPTRNTNSKRCLLGLHSSLQSIRTVRDGYAFPAWTRCGNSSRAV